MKSTEQVKRRAEMEQAQQLLDHEVAEHVMARFMDKPIDVKMMREVKKFATERLRYELQRVGVSEDVARTFFAQVARPSEKMLMLRANRTDRR